MKLVSLWRRQQCASAWSNGTGRSRESLTNVGYGNDDAAGGLRRVLDGARGQKRQEQNGKRQASHDRAGKRSGFGPSRVPGLGWSRTFALPAQGWEAESSRSKDQLRGRHGSHLQNPPRCCRHSSQNQHPQGERGYQSIGKGSPTVGEKVARHRHPVTRVQRAASSCPYHHLTLAIQQLNQ